MQRFRLNFHLQHLIVLAFPSKPNSTHNNSYLQTYYHLLNKGVLSHKLKNHPVYSKQIIEHLDLPANQGWYKNGQLKFQDWYDKYGKWHRDSRNHNGEDLPALIEWYENGQLEYQGWWKDGKYHRDSPKGNLPAAISWYENGQLHEDGMAINGKWEKYTRWFDNGQKAEEGICKDKPGEGMVTWWCKSGEKEQRRVYNNGEEIVIRWGFCSDHGFREDYKTYTYNGGMFKNGICDFCRGRSYRGEYPPAHKYYDIPPSPPTLNPRNKQRHGPV